MLYSSSIIFRISAPTDIIPKKGGEGLVPVKKKSAKMEKFLILQKCFYKIQNISICKKRERGQNDE